MEALDLSGAEVGLVETFQPGHITRTSDPAFQAGFRLISSLRRSSALVEGG